MLMARDCRRYTAAAAPSQRLRLRYQRSPVVVLSLCLRLCTGQAHASAPRTSSQKTRCAPARATTSTAPSLHHCVRHCRAILPPQWRGPGGIVGGFMPLPEGDGGRVVCVIVSSGEGGGGKDCG